MQPLDYLQLQLRLEGKELVNGSVLHEVEHVPSEEVLSYGCQFTPAMELLDSFQQAYNPFAVTYSKNLCIPRQAPERNILYDEQSSAC